MKTIPKILAVTAVLTAMAMMSFADDARPLPAGMISLQSPEGIRLLETSGARANFYALIQHLTTQQRPTYCGVASAVTVLNTVRPSNTPVSDSLNGKFAWFDQVNFFSKAVEQVIPQSTVQQHGFSLDQWAAAMSTYDVKIEKWHCGDADGEANYAAFLAKATAALTSTNEYLVVNFLRKSLGQTGRTGHFSPVGAYNEKENKFLVMDVAQFKYPAFWVDAKLLWDAMNTGDSVSAKHRGFVVVTANPQ
ncbi:MAG TPA: phytochelatin synthase family protein [Candidatus Sulfotelmatobacter sp.]|jgi:hypothetical protein|nr:phytochelatin synthase family protein [Candidatus Sulfotelmatobacter sp.]